MNVNLNKVCTTFHDITVTPAVLAEASLTVCAAAEAAVKRKHTLSLKMC